MSQERHPINQCHFGATVKTLEEKIEWQNRQIAYLSRQLEEARNAHGREIVMSEYWKKRAEAAESALVEARKERDRDGLIMTQQEVAIQGYALELASRDRALKAAESALVEKVKDIAALKADDATASPYRHLACKQRFELDASTIKSLTERNGALEAALKEKP